MERAGVCRQSLTTGHGFLVRTGDIPSVHLVLVQAGTSYVADDLTRP